MFNLTGRYALVTGASGGIGGSIAKALSDAGAKVALSGTRVEALEKAAAEIGGSPVILPCNLSDPAATSALVGQAEEALGGLDILVSNASALVQGARPEDWKAMFEIDILGAVNALDAARPHLEAAAGKTGDAAVVLISSISAAEAAAPSAYGAMKAAQIHFAKGIAREGAAKGLRCNVVSPGTVFFEGGVWGNVKAAMPAFFEQMLKRNPTGRMATPEEIAAATVFLCSPRSAFTTGINMVVDGGLSQRANF